MTAYTVRGRLLLGSQLVPGLLRLDSAGVITEIVRGAQGPVTGPVLDADIIAPGFVDLQVNGGFGVEVGDDPATMRTLAAHLPETGVTAFLPTLVTSPPECYARVFEAFDEARTARGAHPLGLHLEGPWIAPDRGGAHRRELIVGDTMEGLDDVLAHRRDLSLLTVAPEHPAILAHMPALREADVVVSLGHTGASYDTFETLVDAGATMATHLFNAMAPFGHREPGAAGAALLDGRVTVGLIADGLHVHPASVALTLRCKGYDRVALVTDMVAAAGMPDGAYSLGGRRVVRHGSAVRLEDGTLAGSVLTMDGAVRNMVNWGVPIPEALRMASEIPARVVGSNHHGQLTPGAAPGVVLLDSELRVLATLSDGDVVYRRTA